VVSLAETREGQKLRLAAELAGTAEQLALVSAHIVGVAETAEPRLRDALMPHAESASRSAPVVADLAAALAKRVKVA
jgi:hypothetical protein